MQAFMPAARNPIIDIKMYLNNIVSELKTYWNSIFKVGDLSYELALQGIMLNQAVLTADKIHIYVAEALVKPERALDFNPMNIFRQMMADGQAHIAGVDNEAVYVNNSFGFDFEYEYNEPVSQKPTVASTVYGMGLGAVYSNTSEYYSQGKNTVWFDIHI